MNTRIIDTADAVVRRYKTRNPEDIISQRAIKLKDIRFCHDLLGYYTVLLNCEYIGINPNCTAAQRIRASPSLCTYTAVRDFYFHFKLYGTDRAYFIASIISLIPTFMPSSKAVFSHAQHTLPCWSMIFSQSGMSIP